MLTAIALFLMAITAAAQEPASEPPTPTSAPARTSTSTSRLAQGVFGVPWGEYREFPSPMPGCTPNPEPGMAWGCVVKLDGIDVHVGFGYEEDVFRGAVLRAGGGWAVCDRLLHVLDANWGASVSGQPRLGGVDSRMGDRYWGSYEGNKLIGYATWEYNKPAGVCTAVAISKPFSDIVDQKKRERAQRTIGAL